jgi:hypothetical protein
MAEARRWKKNFLFRHFDAEHYLSVQKTGVILENSSLSSVAMRPSTWLVVLFSVQAATQQFVQHAPLPLNPAFSSPGEKSIVV